MIKKFASVSAAFVAANLAHTEPAQAACQTLVASFYGKRFHERLTANGETFNMFALTAAHKTLAFGTRLRVTNPDTGKSVVVRINDRGPHIAGRGLDLSMAAAKQIGMIEKGVGRVKACRL